MPFNWTVLNPNKLTLHIPGSQGIQEFKTHVNHLNLAFLYKCDDIVLNGFDHIPNFVNEPFNRSHVSIRIQHGTLIQDGCLLFLEKTATVYLDDVNLMDPSGYLVTYVQFNYDEADSYITDNKFKLGITYVSSDGTDIGPLGWNHDINRTILNIFKFETQNNKIINVYEHSSDNIFIDNVIYYKKGYHPRPSTSGSGTGDMVKSVYDVNNNNIVDRAERLDDGAGNSLTVLQIINAINRILNIDDTTTSTTTVWSSEKIQTELNNLSLGTIDWVNILNRPNLYTKNDVDLLLLNKSDTSHTHSEFNTILDDSGIFNNKGWSSQKIQTELNNLNSGTIDWVNILNRPLLYTQSEVNTLLGNKSNSDHLHDDRYSLLSHTHSEFVSLDDSGVFPDKGWSSQKIQTELGNVSAGTIDWSLILNRPLLYTQSEINTLLAGKSDTTHIHVISDVTNLQTELNNRSLITHDHDTRYPVLDGDNKIPVTYLPAEYKESVVVLTITDRDNLTDTYEGLRAYVIDASLDSTVNIGGAGYIYYNSSWIKMYEEESLDISLDWTNILNKPTSFDPSTHVHGISDVTNLQTELNNRSLITHNHDTRYPVLDGNDKIPVTYLYAEQHIVVNDIAERDALPNLENGLKVFVKDASADPEVGSGSAGYMYYDGGWVKTYSEQSLNISQQWDDILGKPDLYTQSQIDTFLAGKSDTTHGHSIANITNLQTELNNRSLTTHVHDWSSITNKPELYTQSQINTFLAGKSDTTHVHSIANITNLQTELNNKANITHVHDWTSITNKPDLYTQSQIDTFLAGKSDTTHVHSISQVTNLQTELNNRSLTTHVHDWTSITNRPNLYTQSQIDTFLAGKSDTTHTHTGFATLDDSGVFSNKGWSSQKIQTEISNVSGGGNSLGYEFCIKLGPGASVLERINSSQTIIPSGFSLYQGDNAICDVNFGSIAANLVIVYTYTSHYVATCVVSDYRITGPDGAKGVYIITPLTYKSNTSYTQFYIDNYQGKVTPGNVSYIYFKLINLPI